MWRLIKSIDIHAEHYIDGKSNQQDDNFDNIDNTNIGTTENQNKIVS